MGDKYKVTSLGHGFDTYVYKNGEMMNNVKSFKLEGSWDTLVTLTLELDLLPDEFEFEGEGLAVKETH